MVVDVLLFALAALCRFSTSEPIYHYEMEIVLTCVMILVPTPIFRHFLLIYFALLVTHSPLVPSCAARTVTKSPDKSPDGSPDYSAVNYHMPSLRSLQHSAASSFNPLWMPAHDAPLRSRQLMMELYLELPHHDQPY